MRWRAQITLVDRWPPVTPHCGRGWLGGTGPPGRRDRRRFGPQTVAEGILVSDTEGIDPSVPPSGTGCAECLASDGWWFHLRRCAQCGHIGCCDTSPSQHGTAHFRETGHPVIRSFEPGEDWFWDFRTERGFNGPHLADPQHHPADQPAPGPAGGVPSDWEQRLN